MSWRRRRWRWRRAGGRPAPAARTGDAARPSGARWCRARSPPQRPRPAANKPTAAAAQRAPPAGGTAGLCARQRPAESVARTRARVQQCAADTTRTGKLRTCSGCVPAAAETKRCKALSSACGSTSTQTWGRCDALRGQRRAPVPGQMWQRQAQFRVGCRHDAKEAGERRGLQRTTAGTIPRTRLAPRERQNVPRPASSTACVAAEVPRTCSCAPSCLAAATAAHARTRLRRPMPAPPRS